MGWWFCNPTRKDLVQEIVGDYKDSGRYLGHWSTCYGMRLWVAIRTKSNPEETGIALYLLGKSAASADEFKWGYKGMSEDMHPYYYDCPVQAIEMTNAFGGNETALKWREKVKIAKESNKRRRGVL